ncbi:hypothetical protein ACFV7Q_13165 [Streptomyces sp. NPDC059851]|uniref:NACHT and WD repeat domain-containing protein n=1 Tax=Streptomyces sp. NPDC059851 TaxID=3346971 RepID=UPI00365A77FE
MNPPDGRPPDAEEVHLEAHASDRARIYQARRDLYLSERDLHLHYADGIREARRVVTAGASRECPYPGLAAFGAEQAQWFFGRDALVAKLLVRMDAGLAEGGALVVVAPSGAGKSSLLRAGLLPEVARGALPGSARWPRLWLTPTAHPMAALGGLLSEVVRGSGEVPGDGPDGPVWRPALLRRALVEGGGRTGEECHMVLVVDQLEELFTLCPDEGERRRFLDTVLRIADAGTDGEPAVVSVVLGLRSDFYTQCAGHPGLLDAVERNQVIVGPLSRTGVREAILHPARAVGLDVEPGLVQVLLRDLGAHRPGDADAGTDEVGAYETGRLPLLAHALRATWLCRAGHVLTVDGYESTGGIAHSVTVEADRCFDRLPPQAQRTAPSVFLRLVTFGDGTEDTRRPVRYADLLGRGEQAVAAAEAIETFTRGRLLTRDEDTVTITHEVLLRAWPRLRQWIDAHRARYTVRQRLEEAATAWQQAGRDPGLLYRGGRLDEARTLDDDELTQTREPVVSEFLAASVRQKLRARRIRRGVIAGLAALAVLATASAVFAIHQRNTARDERNTAVLGQIRAVADRVRPTDPSLAAQLDLVAHRMSPATSTETNLLSAQNIPLATTLTGHTDRVNAVDFSPAGRLLASAGSDGTIRLWNTAARPPTQLGAALRGSRGAVRALAFSPGGHLLAGTGDDGTVHLWDVRDPLHPAARSAPVRGAAGALNTLVFSPDGHTLAAAGHAGRIHLWDTTDPGHPRPFTKPFRGSAGEVNGIAFSPDGNLLASGGNDATVRLWQVADRRRPSALGRAPDRIPYRAGVPGHVRAVAFSPDGRTLAVAGSDQKAHLWDVTRPAGPTPLTDRNSNNVVNTVAFSGSGHLMAHGGDDNSIRLENMRAREEEAWHLTPPLEGHAGHVLALDFDPEGTVLASAGADHTVRLWTVPRTILSGHTGYVDTVAVSPDGRLLASGSQDNTVRLWDVRDPAAPRPVSASIRGRTPYVNWVAFSPDGTALAVAAGRTVQLWNVTVPARPRTLSQPLQHPEANFRGVAFTPDGRTLAAGNNDGTVHLWDVSDPSRPAPRGAPLDLHAGPIIRLAISEDGRTLAAAAGNGTLHLWDVSTPARPTALAAPLRASAEALTSVVFSPDGRTVAAPGGDGKIRLWDLTDRTRPTSTGPPLTGHTQNVYTLAFSPDGRTLASGSFDATVRLWDVRGGGRARAHGLPVTGILSYVNAVAFSPDGRFLFLGVGELTVRILPLSTGTATGYVCRATGNLLTPALWHAYVPHLPFDPPCPERR